ncbi:MAG: hypothetical protein ABFS18_02735 [Thermodesulfobacteriota bacterium]
MESKRKLEIATITIAVASALISAYFSIQSRMDVELNNKIKAREILESRNKEIKNWADESINELTNNIHYCAGYISKQEDKITWNNLQHSRIQLSALADRGRILFPNTHDGLINDGKYLRFAGIRDKTVNIIIKAYEQSSEQYCSKHSTPTELEIWKLRKQFVNTVQKRLEPKTREKELKEIISELKNKS